jgi:hypothetical protein
VRRPAPVGRIQFPGCPPCSGVCWRAPPDPSGHTRPPCSGITMPSLPTPTMPTLTMPSLTMPSLTTPTACQKQSHQLAGGSIAKYNVSCNIAAHPLSLKAACMNLTHYCALVQRGAQCDRACSSCNCIMCSCMRQSRHTASLCAMCQCISCCC